MVPRVFWAGRRPAQKSSHGLGFPRFEVPRVFWTGRRPVQKMLGVFASIFYGFVTILEGKMVKNHTKS